MKLSFKYMLVQLGVLALAACSSGPSRVKSMPTAPVVSTSSEIDAAFGQLMQGNERAAASKLKAVVKREPLNPSATMLLASLKGDPREELGPQNYAYKVRAGDTMQGLAQRLLGNKYKAYQLLRYNQLRAPVALAVGQEIRIPGEMPRPEPVRRAEPEPAKSSAPAAASKPKLRPATPKPAAPATTGANPAAARQLRTQGLAALNQGQVNRAVNLLGRAKQLDPANPLIGRDLERAQRIAATVKARK